MAQGMDEFAAEQYGDWDFRTAEEVAVVAAEAVEYMEWELAAAATEAYDQGRIAVMVFSSRNVAAAYDSGFNAGRYRAAK